MNQPHEDSISYCLIQIWNIFDNTLRTKANIKVELYPSKLQCTWKSNVCLRCRNKFDSTALFSEKITKVGEEPLSGNSISCHKKALRFILLLGFLLFFCEIQHTHSGDSCGTQIWGSWEDVSFNPRHLESFDWIILEAQIALKGENINVPLTRKLQFEYLLKCDMK